MPKLTVEGAGPVEVPSGKRLVLALLEEAAVDQLHACGGNARCTTCRVEFVAGEPEAMTVAEKSVLAEKVSGPFSKEKGPDTFSDYGAAPPSPPLSRADSQWLRERLGQSAKK